MRKIHLHKVFEVCLRHRRVLNWTLSDVPFLEVPVHVYPEITCYYPTLQNGSWKCTWEVISERQWFSTGGDFTPLGAFGNVGWHLGLSQMEGTVLLARDAAEHPIMHRKPCTTKNYPDQDVKGWPSPRVYSLENCCPHRKPDLLQWAGSKAKLGAPAPYLPSCTVREDGRRRPVLRMAPPRLVARSWREGMEHGNEEL